jgi:hypothetical protein
MKNSTRQVTRSSTKEYEFFPFSLPYSLLIDRASGLPLDFAVQILILHLSLRFKMRIEAARNT